MHFSKMPLTIAHMTVAAVGVVAAAAAGAVELHKLIRSDFHTGCNLAEADSIDFDCPKSCPSLEPSEQLCTYTIHNICNIKYLIKRR